MKYEKEELEQITIYSLRNVAREIGVKSPTALKKGVLIDEILQIQSGKKKPYVPSKKGRPVKTYVENKSLENKRRIIKNILNSMKKDLKKNVIPSILKEVEKKLNEIL